MERLRILVTGATGNVGRPLAELLAAAGAEVCAAVRDPAKEGSSGWASRITPVAFDFQAPSTWAPALAGVDKLFLLRPPAISDVRRHMVPLVYAAREAGVRHIVFLSLLGVQNNPVVPHAKVEQALRESGVPTTSLRPGFFMQNLSTTHREDIRTHGEIFVPAGRGKTSFIDTRDIAAVAARTLLEPGHEGKAYELTGAQALDYSEVAALFTEVLGRPIRYPNPSALRFAWRWYKRGTPLPYIAVMVALYTVSRLGKAGRVTHEVEQLLGRPPLSLRQFIVDHRACWG